MDPGEITGAEVNSCLRVMKAASASGVHTKGGELGKGSCHTSLTRARNTAGALVSPKGITRY